MTLSKDDFRDVLAKNPGLRKRNQQLTDALFPELSGKKAGKGRLAKYRNQKVFIYEDGFVSYGEKACGHGRLAEKYDSVKEYRRWTDLQLMERAGRISELHRQVKLTIQEAFDYRDERVGTITYVADHMYVRDGETVVEDVKGQDKNTGAFITTKDFSLKWKLLKHHYPMYVFEIF